MTNDFGKSTMTVTRQKTAANDLYPALYDRIVSVENVGEQKKERERSREGSVSFRRGVAYDQVARRSAG